uniref:Cyclin B3 1 n=1 Tax=Echinococcus granulosus TaxID=6210 RepID=A0A068WPM6_ECHGR|nr:cyclin B3 1 [Echinococcus granulosus]
MDSKLQPKTQLQDVHQAPTTDPALPQVGALNPVHDGQRTSSPDTALFQVEASNLEMDFRYAPTAYTFLPRWESTSPVIDVYYAATPDTSELHEESPNLAFGEEGTPNLNPLLPELEESAPMIVASESSTSNGPSVDPQMIQLVADLLGRVRSAHGGVDLFFDTVYHLEQIFSRVPEHRRPFIGHFIANLPIKNQVYEELMEVFQIIGYPDPIRRGDIQLFLKTLTLELGLDAEYMQAYNHQFLSRFYLAPDTRDYVIQWMILILWWRGIPTRILHAAVGLMDLYTWLRPITRQDYQLLALAAITMSIRTRSPNIQINHFDLCTTANHVYTQGQILRMEEMLRECIGRRINFPTPHRFLDFYLFGLTEFTASMLEWSRKACNYIFELGLCQDYLCRYSASLRCCAVLYLIRQILRLRETMNLKRLAKFYGQILLSIEEEVIPHYLAHHTNVQYTVVFSKYVREEYNAIAMDLKIRFLTQDFLNTFMTT